MNTIKARRGRAKMLAASSSSPEGGAASPFLVDDGYALVRVVAPALSIPQLLLTIEGSVVSSGTAVIQDGELAARLPLPAFILGGMADVVAAETGQSVLPAPFDLSTLQTFSWTGWSITDQTIKGRFTLEGPAVSQGDVTIPVNISLDGASYAAVFAMPDPAKPGEMQFSCAIRTLVRLGTTTVISARIGNILLAETIELSPADCGLVGFVDPTEAPYAEGWVIDLKAQSRPVKLELLIRGQVVARGTTDRARQDVKNLGFTNSRSGFRIMFPNGIHRDSPMTVGVRIAATGLHLCSSPYTLAAHPPYLGYFDAIDGSYASGWAANMRDPGAPLQVEAVCDGEVIASSTADLYRGDVVEAGIPTSKCGFRFPLGGRVADLIGRDIIIRVKTTGETVRGSPRQVDPNNNILRYLSRGTVMHSDVVRRLTRMVGHRTSSVMISIIMPIYNTPRTWLVEALNSVLQQWSPNWELICIDDGSTKRVVAEVLEAAGRHDPRIRVLRSADNLGIARTTNFGLRAARGQYVTFLDHDDFLEPDAIFKLAEAAIQTGADLLYSDEALTSENIRDITHVVARPAFSYDYYLSHPYFVHMICVRTDVARQLSGWDESLPISADVDFVLRVLEVANAVTHIPRVLYRWRTHSTSAGHAKKALVMETMLASLDRHLTRRRTNATVSAGLHYNSFRIDWPDDNGEVFVVIPTKNRVDLLKPCLASLERTASADHMRIVVIDHESDDPKTLRFLKSIAGRHTVMPYSGPFNYAAMNNLAVRTHGEGAGYVVFMNNDVEAIDPGWLPRLRSLAARKDVGAVGPLLLYGDRRIQHAGVLMAYNGAADHVAKFVYAYEGSERALGYNCILTSVRDYSAVTAACVMIRCDVFEQVGGFDERFVIGFNDTDLCLRIQEAGYKVLYDGHTVLLHHESATRAETDEVKHPEDDTRLRTRWARYFNEGDPFYSPILARKGTDHVLRGDASCKNTMQPRMKTLNHDPVDGGEIITKVGQ